MKKLLAVLCIVMSGCSGISFKSEMVPTSSDITMYGKNGARDFTDSSHFIFPLKEQWEYDATGGFGQYPPIIVGTTMFFGILRGEFHAINVETGKRIGYFKTQSPIQASPVLLGHLIVYCTESGENNILAYSLTDGVVVWTRDVGGVAAPPAVRNDTLYIAGLDGKLYRMAQYGIIAWSFDTKEEIRSALCLNEQSVFCASTDGTVYAVNINDGTLRWKFKTNASIYAGLTLHDTTLIAASRDSTVYLLDPADGRLKRKIWIGNKVMATPAVSNGIVYIPSLDQTVGAYRLDTGELLWKFTAKGVINTTPLITPTAIFVASLDKNLYALSPDNGTVLWKMEFPARIKTTPLIWKNSLFVAAEDRTIYCLQ